MQPRQSQPIQEADRTGDVGLSENGGNGVKRRRGREDKRQASLKKMRLLLDEMRAPSLSWEVKGGAFRQEDTLIPVTPPSSANFPPSVATATEPPKEPTPTPAFVRSTTPPYISPYLLDALLLHSYNPSLPADPIQLRSNDVWRTRDDVILAAQKKFRHNSYQCQIVCMGPGARVTLRCCRLGQSEEDGAQCRAFIKIGGASEDKEGYWRIVNVSGIDGPGPHNIQNPEPEPVSRLIMEYRKFAKVKQKANKAARAAAELKAKEGEEGEPEAASQHQPEPGVNPDTSPSSLPLPISSISIPPRPSNITATTLLAPPPTLSCSLPTKLSILQADQKANKKEKRKASKQRRKERKAQAAEQQHDDHGSGASLNPSVATPPLPPTTPQSLTCSFPPKPASSATSTRLTLTSQSVNFISPFSAPTQPPSINHLLHTLARVNVDLAHEVQQKGIVDHKLLEWFIKHAS